MERAAKIFLLVEPASRQHGARNYSAAKWGAKSIFRRLKERTLPPFGSSVASTVPVTKKCIMVHNINIPRKQGFQLGWAGNASGFLS